jgi:hypothetical protein
MPRRRRTIRPTTNDARPHRRSTRTARGGGRIPPQEPYPQSVAECLEDGRKYKPDVLRVMKAFRRDKPWRGTLIERKAKIVDLHLKLCHFYGLTTALDTTQVSETGNSGASCYEPGRNRITLRGRLSVVTYLHEFGHALGYGEQGACRWSLNLFRRIFPNSYERLQHVGHTLTRPGDASAPPVGSLLQAILGGGF